MLFVIYLTIIDICVWLRVKRWDVIEKNTRNRIGSASAPQGLSLLFTEIKETRGIIILLYYT